MREAAFVKQNKEKWMAFEKAIHINSKINPNTLANHYINLTNDLSYAKTYYPESNELNKYGIQFLLTSPEDLSINTINKYLEIKPLGLI